ncbi:sigma-70 family RNA polymerase sigma factor [Terricaulis sp.]|uniref:sigma-70 family RNA polymerase sigma factor n=1 Tax=Terricaulis sp. TaxID=2768686 RepID=UPI00378350BB
MSALALIRTPGAAAALMGKKAFVVHSRVEETDEALLARIARGDRDAFALTFQKYAPKVKSYLIRLGAPKAAAEDLAQDAMVSVWRRAASFDPVKAKASTWVFVIARNAWIDKLRREKVELAYRETADEPCEGGEAPDDAAVRTQTEVNMQAAMATLSEEQKQVVRLAFFEDRPHSEIASVLALPLGTVKSRLRLALIKLRAHWEQYA